MRGAKMTEVILDDKQACKFASLICVVDILEYIDTHKEEYEYFLQKTNYKKSIGKEKKV